MFIDVARLKIGSVRYLPHRQVFFPELASVTVIVSLRRIWTDFWSGNWNGDRTWIGKRSIDWSGNGGRSNN
jgi:hypothetical protein